MSRSQAIALLLMAACVALAAAKPTLRPMYDEWLEQQGEAKISAAEDDGSEYGDYPKLEHETVCLKATAFENCIRCVPPSIQDPANPDATITLAQPCDTFQFETKVACCNGIQTNGNYYYPDDDPEETIPTPPVVIGSCTTKVDPFVQPIDMGSGHKKLATFVTICTIPHGSLCGAPFCNDLQLVQNGILMQGLAVSKNDPRISPPAGWSFDQCPVLSGSGTEFGWIDGGLQDSLSNRTAKRVHVMGAETEGYGYGGDSSYGGYPNSPPSPPPTTTWYKGLVEVYSGPVTIYSKKHAFKYHFGHMEFTNWAGNTTVVSTKGKYPEVNPWTFTLKMNKPQGY